MLHACACMTRRLSICNVVHQKQCCKWHGATIQGRSKVVWRHARSEFPARSSRIVCVEAGCKKKQPESSAGCGEFQQASMWLSVERRTCSSCKGCSRRERVEQRASELAGDAGGHAIGTRGKCACVCRGGAGSGRSCAIDWRFPEKEVFSFFTKTFFVKRQMDANAKWI